jgi:hypothetical protein
MLAYDYPLLNVFWTMIIFFLFVAWLMVLFRTIGDIIRSSDISGVGKFAWMLFVIVIPWLGVLVYILARGEGMTRRDLERMQAQQASFDSYVRETASSGSGPADELTKLADLRDRGVITDTEFADQKAKLLT